MHILHTNCDYLWTSLHQLMVKNLEQQDVQSTVFSPVYTRNNAVIAVFDNEIIKICFNKYDKFFFHLKQRKILRAFGQEFNEQQIRQFDILHAYYLFTDGNYTRKIALQYNIPYVVAVRNTDVNTFFRYMPHLRRLGVKIMMDAEKVFFLSETYKNTVMDKYVPEEFRNRILEKSIVIPNGIDDFWFQNIYEERDYTEIERRFKNKELRLLYAGDIDKNKNIGLTVEVIKMLKSDGWNVRFDVVGRIVEQKVFDKIKSDIFYTPKLPKEELIKKYRKSDIFVMPSHKESFGLVYAEAMSQGLPVIYTRGQGFDRQFPEGEVGYSVNSYNATELYRILINVMAEYKKLSLTSRKSVNKFRWQNITFLFKKIYNSIIEKH